MARVPKKVESKVEIKVGEETSSVDVVMSPELLDKVATIKENKENKESDASSVQVVAPTKPLQTTKMVKVMLNKPHRCHIGGEWYSFQANKQYNVPEQVKLILMKANLLLPL